MAVACAAGEPLFVAKFVFGDIILIPFVDQDLRCRNYVAADGGASGGFGAIPERQRFRPSIGLIGLVRFRDVKDGGDDLPIDSAAHLNLAESVATFSKKFGENCGPKVGCDYPMTRRHGRSRNAHFFA
ncbi:MAG TPA: hypothetical protein VF175_14655 [Lacipirellula sp.]